MDRKNETAQSPVTFPCPQCGAQLGWNPATQQASCEFCGYSRQVAADAPPPGAPQQAQAQPQARGQAAVREHDLFAFLRSTQAAKTQGFGIETKTITCKSCAAAVSVDSKIASTECPFCGSNMVVEQPANESLIRPESLIPLQIDRNAAIRTYRQWLAKGWFHPGDLKNRANRSKIYGVYLPFWTFDTQASSNWSAESGTYYYETETYTQQENGRMVTKTRQVRKIRWWPSSGHHAALYDDVLICASGSVELKLMEKIYPYDTKKLVAYDPHYLSGWEAEQYRVQLGDGWQAAADKVNAMEVQVCGREVPGDTHRNLSVQTSFSDVTFKHVLLPLWISSYRYKKKVFRFLINGETGKIHGEKPLSWFKIVLLIIICAIIASAIVGLINYFS